MMWTENMFVMYEVWTITSIYTPTDRESSRSCGTFESGAQLPMAYDDIVTPKLLQIYRLRDKQQLYTVMKVN